MVRFGGKGFPPRNKFAFGRNVVGGGAYCSSLLRHYGLFLIEKSKSSRKLSKFGSLWWLIAVLLICLCVLIAFTSVSCYLMDAIWCYARMPEYIIFY